MSAPHLIVLTNLFPHASAPTAGLFIRQRMFRVAQQLPMTVVVPVPWFPLEGLIRLWRPGFRPPAPRKEVQSGIDVVFPRFLSMPGIGRRFDGIAIALACLPWVRRLLRAHPDSIIDGHFAFPCGYAATTLGRWLGLPSTITMRGTEVSLSAWPARRRRIVDALNRATRVFAVSESLRRYAGTIGVDTAKILVVGNGVDLGCFKREDRAAARARIGLPPEAPVLVSVGGLVERKGFHRVIEQLPALRQRFPGLVYLVIGGSSPEGDMSARLREQAAALDLKDAVRFLGPLPAEELRWPLSAADVFVLATRNEGWANVFLEAMACGLPVVTTDVGGNSEVVCRDELGTIVPFGDGTALLAALDAALRRSWDRAAIQAHAAANTWDRRVAVLVDEFRALSVGVAGTSVTTAGAEVGHHG